MKKIIILAILILSSVCFSDVSSKIDTLAVGKVQSFQYMAPSVFSLTMDAGRIMSFNDGDVVIEGKPYLVKDGCYMLVRSEIYSDYSGRRIVKYFLQRAICEGNYFIY